MWYFIVGLYSYVKARQKDEKIFDIYNALNNWCEEMKDEERD